MKRDYQGDCGWFCLMCHPRRALAAYVVCGLGYIGFLWAVLSWLP